VRHRPRSPVLRTMVASTAMGSLLNKLPRCSFRIWPAACIALCGCSSVGERHLARVEAAGSRLAIRSTSGVPLRHRRRAAAGTARRDVHGVAPRVQREHLAGMPAARAGAQPKWKPVFASCSSNRQGSLTFNQETRVRIPYTTPFHPFNGPLTQWPECAPVEGEAAGSTPARTASKNICRASSMDQSTALRRRGLHIRVVRAAPASVSFA